MDRYAVVGNPIAHSKSPAIHGMFAEQTGEPMVYDKLLASPESFAEEATAFFALGGKGLNVTVPFKEEAYLYADALTDRGRVAKAINTLVLQPDGSILGDNTDGAGFMCDLKRLGWSVEGKRVLVLGAGGAVRGILHPMFQSRPAEVVIVNRTDWRAENLATAFEPYGEVRGGGFDAVGDTCYDLVINGTSSSLSGDIPPVPTSAFSAQTCVYDLMYAKELTAFLAWAQELGVHEVADGLGMLVGQAAEAFRVWRGKVPDINAVLEALREVEKA